MGLVQHPLVPGSGGATCPWKVARSESGWSLVDFVFNRLVLSLAGEPVSRSEARRVVVAGAALVNGVAVRRPAFRLHVGMRVEVRRRRQAINEITPPLRILFDDGVLLAVDKPAGLPTVPSADPRRPSLISRIAEEFTPRGGGGRGPALGVHQRLDAQTSGVVVFVTDDRANAGLAQQIETRQVSKRYLALVERPSRDVPRAFSIDDPVGQSTNGPGGRMAVRADGRPAVTAVRVLESLPEALLVEARPATGRKHQIRIHLASRGLPILGDPLHAPPAARKRAPRLMLHAAEIGLRHPLTGSPLRITSELPPDFVRALTLEREKRGHRYQAPSRSTEVRNRRARRA